MSVLAVVVSLIVATAIVAPSAYEYRRVQNERIPAQSIQTPAQPKFQTQFKAQPKFQTPRPSPCTSPWSP